MMIPPKLTHGDNLQNLFEKFNAVIDYLREIRLVAGNGIRINRLPAGTTIESTATASGSAPMASASKWHCDITETGNTVSVKVYVRRVEDDNVTLRFRGETYGVDSETFSLSSNDLNTSVKIYLVKVLYGGHLAFRLATSHNSIYGPSSGCVRIATVFRRNDQIQVTMDYDRMFDWPDRFQGDGRFTADLVFSGIIHNDDEPQPIPFYEFTETAEQKLAIWKNYALLINGVYVIGTSVVSADGSESGYTLISLRPSGLETAALRIFWAAEVDYSSAGALSPANIHYEVIGSTGYPYQPRPGMIRIPLLALSSVDSYNPVRYILPNVGIPNVPELSIDPFGYDLSAEKCSWLHVDHSAGKVKLSIEVKCDGIFHAVPTFDMPFSTFSNAGNGQWLNVHARYNTGSHQWTAVWFTLNGIPITSWTPTSGGDIDHFSRIAVIGYNSADGFPYIVGQNFTKEFNFSSADYRFQELADLIAQSQYDIVLLADRVTALEQRN